MTPRLTDDGRRPVLDLHGCSVAKALALTRALIVESVKRGRDSVELIHGSSTSHIEDHRPTIRSALRKLISSGRMSLHVGQYLKRDASMVVALRRQTRQPDRRPITLQKISRQ